MKTVIIFPYYNEAKRINLISLQKFIASIGLDVMFISDGSTDDSTELISKLANQVAVDIKIMKLEKNIGKTNALRIAMLRSLEVGYELALTQDVDLPYSDNDAIRAIRLMKSDNVDIYSGARVRLAGSGTLRSPLRQWAGRMIATVIYVFYSKDFYDPQSPCKVYRLKSIQDDLIKNFKSRWFGDVELLYRSRNNGKPLRCKEFLLEEWHDKPDGNLKISSVFQVLTDLVKIRFT